MIHGFFHGPCQTTLLKWRPHPCSAKEYMATEPSSTAVFWFNKNSQLACWSRRNKNQQSTSWGFFTVKQLTVYSFFFGKEVTKKHQKTTSCWSKTLVFVGDQLPNSCYICPSRPCAHAAGRVFLPHFWAQWPRNRRVDFVNKNLRNRWNEQYQSNLHFRCSFFGCQIFHYKRLTASELGQSVRSFGSKQIPAPIRSPFFGARAALRPFLNGRMFERFEKRLAMGRKFSHPISWMVLTYLPKTNNMDQYGTEWLKLKLTKSETISRLVKLTKSHRAARMCELKIPTVRRWCCSPLLNG